MPGNAKVFQPIEHESVAESIIEQIEVLLLSGVLKGGARLPPERELAERLGVSRPKLREALKTLEERGLIVVRHGDGTFVAQLIGAAMSPALIALYARHTGAFLDYLEFRSAQEELAASLAAERATDADRDILCNIMRNFELAHETDDLELAQTTDIAFHSAIVDATHNSLLIHTMSSIYALTRQNMFYNRGFLRTLDGAGNKLLAQHKTILAEILNGDSSAAAAAAAAHIDFVRQSYLVHQSREQRQKIATLRGLAQHGTPANATRLPD